MAAGFAACGGDSEPPTVAPTPAPTPTPPTVVSEGSYTLPVQEGFINTGRLEFTTTAPGTLDITVDWTDPANSIDLIVSTGICTFDQLNANECELITFSRGTTPKPRNAVLANRPAGSYTQFIGNVGPGDESVSYQIVLRPTGPLAAARRRPVDLTAGDSKRPYGESPR